MRLVFCGLHYYDFIIKMEFEKNGKKCNISTSFEKKLGWLICNICIFRDFIVLNVFITILFV